MRPRSRVPIWLLRARRTTMIAVLACAAQVAILARTASPAEPAQATNAQAVQLQEFQDRLAKYLQLRSDLAKKLKPLSTASAAELTAQQDSLASAIRAARKDAERGDI